MLEEVGSKVQLGRSSVKWGKDSFQKATCFDVLSIPPGRFLPFRSATDCVQDRSCHLAWGETVSFDVGEVGQFEEILRLCMLSLM